MSDFTKITEQSSPYRDIEKMPVADIVAAINNEDKKVAIAVEQALPQIVRLVETASEKLKLGGRLFYIGAGTSGRLGILDASEVVPTFGVPEGLIVAIIAGGKKAVTQPVENAEDVQMQGWNDLVEKEISKKDLVVGIASSGTTPYVVGALMSCRKHGIATGCITCNPGSPVADLSDFPVEVVVGPEFITGSTRMKSGTAQKMVLNMISTTVMIQLGRVEDNGMVHMKLSNEKVRQRGTRMIMEKTGITDPEEAKRLLITTGSVKKALEIVKSKSSYTSK